MASRCIQWQYPFYFTDLSVSHLGPRASGGFSPSRSDGTPVVSRVWMMTTPSTHTLLRGLPHGIEDFARDAASQTSIEALRDLLATLPEHLLSLSRCATFDSSAPTRRVLSDTSGAVIELRGWLPGQHTEPQDHGPARCAFRVLAGIAVESRYDRDTQGRACEVACDRFLTGSVLVCDLGQIHSITNDGFSSEPLVTLHVFSPSPRTTTYRIRPVDAKETWA